MAALSAGRLTLFVFAAVLAGCGGPAVDEEPYGRWRAVMTVAGGDLPFGLEITHAGGRDVAYLINGPERAEVTDVVVDGGRVSMGMPGYPHRLEARLEDGQLRGQVTFLVPGGQSRASRLVAERGVTWRFFPEPDADPRDFSGRWSLTFRDPETGDERTGIAELSQQAHVVTGTILRDSGDERYLAGEVRGDVLYLSRFDGGSARLYVARVDERGELTGRAGRLELSGRRDEAATLRDVTRLTRLRADAGRPAFALPDVDGRIVTLQDERFRDKVVILTIGGTWCPNCHDEAVFLRDFLRSRRGQGLEVVQLMFEYTDDFASASASVRDFIGKFGIDYPVLVAGSYGAGSVQEVLPEIESFYAYPTMLVLDRDGRIRYTHTGFSGPATGAHYEEFGREFGEMIDGLLASRPEEGSDAA